MSTHHIDVFYLSLKEGIPCNDYWDYGMINDFIDGNLWKPANFPVFKKHEVSKLSDSDRAFVILPARHHHDLVDLLSFELRKINRVVLLLMGDEEGVFPVEKVKHSNIDIWVMSPRPGRHDKYKKLGTGYPPQARQYLANTEYKKSIDVFFSGQVTHQRREDMWAELDNMHMVSKDIIKTPGFTQGLKPKDYFARLARARIAPAPSGPETPDSFRLFEALEAMAVPIADDLNPEGDIEDYWQYFFDQAIPFPTIKDYQSLPGYINTVIGELPELSHRITAWWIAYKRDLAYRLLESVNA